MMQVRKNQALKRIESVRGATVLTVCLGAIALLALAYWAGEYRLPDPAKADREGLVRWLALRDIVAEPPETRVALLHRFQEEAAIRQFDVAALRTGLRPEYEERLWRNVELLMETWYLEKVDDYQTITAAERGAYLDQMIVEIDRFKSLAELRPGGENGPSQPSDQAVIELFTEQVAVWAKSASPERRQEFEQFNAALAARWVLQKLGWTTPS